MARKRKATVRREPNGQAQREPARVIRELAELNRVKHQGVPEKDAGDPLAGFTLGVLLLRGRAGPKSPPGITQQQYEAGSEWGRICRYHAFVMGYESKGVASPSLTAGQPGRDNFDHPESTVFRVRERFRTGYDGMCKLTATLPAARVYQIMLVVQRVCIDSVPVAGLSERDFGNLRLGLNALAKALGVGR